MAAVKPRVYLDTTVPSAYLDARSPDRQRLTAHFWNFRLPEFVPMISTIVLSEIRDTPDIDKRGKIEKLVEEFDVVEFDVRADDLAQRYVQNGIFPDKYESDARHVAVAVVNGIAYFASLNFRHLVKVKTRREINSVNALQGYGPIEIVAPPEL